MTIDFIFLDIDEVLADWVSATLKLLGLDPNETLATWDTLDPRPWDLFSVIDHSSSEAWEKIHAQGAEFWRELEPYPWAYELVRLCQSTAPTVLLTTPSNHSSSHAGKFQWIRRHFGESFHEYLIGVPKHVVSRPGVVLIDDSPRNCEAFTERGGTAVLFPGVGNELYRVPANARLGYVRSKLKELSRA